MDEIEDIENMSQFFHELANDGEQIREENANPEDFDLRLRRLNRKVDVLKALRENAAKAAAIINAERDALIKRMAALLGLEDDEEFRNFIDADKF